MRYTEIRAIEPVLEECFFAFSNQQFADGKVRMNIVDKKIVRGFGGLFGTQAGIDKLMGFYDVQAEQIAKECEPQDVYNYEFSNHECYTCDDEEAIKIVLSYFGLERTKEVKRKWGYFKIESDEVI